MDKILYLLTEGVKNTWRHKMTTFTAILSLFIALYIIGVLAFYIKFLILSTVDERSNS